MHYKTLLASAENLLSSEPTNLSLLSNASAFINDHITDLNWVGFYLYKNGILTLGPFQGKVACNLIMPGKGVVGTAYSKNESIVIKNVHEIENHITCDPVSMSEFVAPISNENGDVSVYQKVIAGSENRLLQAEEKLQAYESEVERYRKQNFPIDQLAKECKLHFPYVDTLAVANVVYGSPDKSTLDTVPTAFLSLKKNTVPEDKKKVEEWLKLRLSLKKLKVYIN